MRRRRWGRSLLSLRRNLVVTSRDDSKSDQAHLAADGIEQERRGGRRPEEWSGVEDAGLSDHVIFGGEGVAAEQVVVLLFLEQLVNEFLVVAVSDDEFFAVGFKLAHDA